MPRAGAPPGPWRPSAQALSSTSSIAFLRVYERPHTCLSPGLWKTAHRLDLGDPRVDHPVVFTALHLSARLRGAGDETDHDAGRDDGLEPRRHLLEDVCLLTLENPDVALSREAVDGRLVQVLLGLLVLGRAARQERGHREARRHARTRASCHRRRLEPDVHAEAAHYRRGHVDETPARADGLAYRGVHDLQVRGQVEPRSERGVVVELSRVLEVEAQVERLTEERHELGAELRARPAYPHVVVGPARDDAIGAEARAVEILDGVGVAIGDAEPEEHAHAPVRVTRGTPEILVEVVVHRPSGAFRPWGLHRDEELGKEFLDEAPQERPGILQARESTGHEQAGDVGRVLIDRE